jgi:WD40 repeat protein
VLAFLFPILTPAQEKEFKAPHKIKRVAVSPDNKTVAVAGEGISTTELSWFTIQTGERRGTVNVPTGVAGLAFSPDGKMIITAGGPAARRPLRIWKLATGAEAIETQEHETVLFAFAIRYPTEKPKLLDPLKSDSSKSKSPPPDSSKGTPSLTPGIAATNGDTQGEIAIWDIRTGKVTQILKGHKGHVVNLAFLPDGRLISSEAADTDTGADRILKIWDVAEKKQVGSFQCGRILALAPSPDGRMIAVWEAVGAVNALRLLDVKMDEEPLSLTIPKYGTHRPVLSFSPDSNYLAADYGGGAIVWDIKKREHVIWVRDIGAKCVAFTPDGGSLIVTSADTIRIYDMKNLLKK